MLTRKMARFSAVALVGLASVLATEARAQLPNGQAQTAPLTCTAPLAFSNESVTVVAVPGGTSATFPHDVTGGSCPSGQTCTEYNYTFTSSNGSNLTKAYLSLSSDLNIYEVSPAAFIENPVCEGDGNLIGRFVCEQRQIRFNSQPSGFAAKVVVTRSTPRVSTGGAIVGFLQTGFCLIQGPGVPGNIINAASVEATLLVANGHCLVKVAQGSDGVFTSVALPPNSPCTITVSDTAPVINNEPVQIPPGKFVTFGTNSCSVTARRVVNGKYVTVCLVP